MVASLDALADAIRADGSIDWLKFAQLRKFAVLPRSAIAANAARSSFGAFPRLCETADSDNFKENALHVLKTHLLRSARANFSRRALGKLLSQNRELDTAARK